MFAPLPDETARKTVVTPDHIPVLLKVAGAVSHRVRVLIHDERLRTRTRPVLARMRNLAMFADADRIVSGILLEPARRRIGLTVEISDDVHVGILNRPRIEFPDTRGHRLERGSVSGLVAPHEPVGAVDRCGSPNRIVAGKHTGVIGELVTLDVGFVDHVESVPVAEFVPERMIHVMAAPHRVEIGRFHHLDVADHRFARDRTAAPGIDFVPVHAVQLDRFSVEQKRPAADLDRAESGAEMADVEHFTAAAQSERHRIEVRRFGAPEFDPVELRFECRPSGNARGNPPGKVAHTQLERTRIAPAGDLAPRPDRATRRISADHGVREKHRRS